MLILSFGFDHRNVDGAEGADFAYTLIDMLTDPDRLLLGMS
jgi:pyruvate/2-oxoglutarate dehydrogenase complex dihydrolipoamide acyltransferase (E2) component